MKTRRLSIGLFALGAALAMLVIAGVFTTVPARAEVDPASHCICGSATETHLPGCDGSVQTWTAWTNATSLPDKGYYYLSAGVTVSTYKTLTGNLFLDLNGQTITSTSNDGVFWINQSSYAFTLLDSKGGGLVDINASTLGARGGFVFLANKGVKVFNMYGGTVDASDTRGTAANGAGLVRTYNDTSNPTASSTVNIYGGTLIGARITNTSNSGSILLGAASTMNMYGGVLQDGFATHGGNVNVKEGAALNLFGGEIKGGSGSDTEGSGGNIVLYGKMTMTGGIISGGRSSNAGNIKVTATAELSVSGGEICNGRAVKQSSGGNIDITSGGKVTLSGLAKIYGGTNASGSSDINGAVSGTANSYCECGFVGGQHLGNCPGTAMAYTPWMEAGLPKTSGTFYLTEDVTVSTTINLGDAQQLTIDLNGKTVTSTCLDRLFIVNNTSVKLTILDTVGTGRIILGGTNGGAFAHLVNKGNKELTIYGGTIDGSAVVATAKRSGSVISSHQNTAAATVNIHGGTLIGGRNEYENGGGTIYMTVGTGTSATLNITGGTITGGTAGGTGDASGGNIYIASNTVLNISGGTIQNGVSEKHGGNIHLSQGAVMNMSGGTILNGRAKTHGGNIYCKGTINLDNGSISGGLADYMKSGDGTGGNILLSGAVMNMSGGTVSGGSARNGGNVAVTSASSLTMEGGEIFDGSASSDQAADCRGGNIYNSGAGASVTVTAPAKVYDGYAKYEGCNLANLNNPQSSVEDGCMYLTKWDHAEFALSLTLKDSIAIRMHVSNITDNPKRYTVEYTFKDVTASATCSEAEENIFVVADCTANEMADEVTIRVIYGGTDVVAQNSYSVKDYCDYQIENAESETLKELCKAVLTYGEASQRFFNYNLENLPTSVNPAIDLSDRAAAGITISASDNAYYAAIQSGEPILATLSASLSLESRPRIRFRMTALPGVDLEGLQITVKQGETDVAFEDSISGSVRTIFLEGVYPNQLDAVYTLTVGDGESATVITYSAMTYIARQENTADTALDAVCRALQYYFNKAVAYVDSLS